MARHGVPRWNAGRRAPDCLTGDHFMRLHRGAPLAALALILAAGCDSQPARPGSTLAAAAADAAVAPGRGTSSLSAPARLASDGATARPANYNILAASKLEVGPGPRVAAVPAGSHVDTRLGVPTFLWADDAQRTRFAAAAAPRSAADAARTHLRLNAALYGLSGQDVDQAAVTEVHDLGRGPIIVKLRQSIGGIEVFREEAAVLLDRALRPVAISGHLSPAPSAPSAPAASLRAGPSTGGSAFALGETEAIARALTDVTGEAFAAPDLVAGGRTGAYLAADLGPGAAAARGERFTAPARAKPVWFRLPSGLEPAYYLEVRLARPGGSRLDYGYVLSAATGKVLFRKDLTAYDAYSYRVWASATSFQPDDGPQGTAGDPHPTGVPNGFQPAFVPQTLVTLSNAFPPSAGVAATDPWLPAGATQLTGNNADAYADISGQDGFDASDVRGLPSAAGAFDYTYDLGADASTATNVQAALAQLFYDVNFFHDWYYLAGFDEAAGNAQASNYGRGGAEGDPIRAEAQDSSGTDNANMATPADGGSPRMQMFLWHGNGAQFLKFNGPANLVSADFGYGVPGSALAGVALGFGPSAFNLTGNVVRVNDGSTGPVPTDAGPVTGTIYDACEGGTWPTSVAGKIALADRGACKFALKAKNAQDNGAVGLIITNVSAAQKLGNMANDPSVTGVTIPVLLVDQVVGDAIKGQTATVGVIMFRQSVPMRDGTIDNQIVAHEWGHYISNRLVHDAAGLDNNQGGSLGEGWGDTHALLLTVREGSALDGTYGLAGFVSGGYNWNGGGNEGYYFGLRRVPYSTDMSKDPLTFKHWANGNPISGATNIQPFGTDGASNAEVHNAGEVWATMLWECYAALLGAHDFATAQVRWRDYLVAAYKVTPASPTLLEARDALLSVARASDNADYLLLWAAFAKRGAGAGATGPDRYSVDHVPVVESYAAGKVLAVTAASLTTVTSTCNDGDAILDNQEQATYTITVKNIGSAATPATTATLSSTDGRVSFPAGTSVSIPALALGATAGDGATADVQITVALAGAGQREALPITLTFPAADVDVPASFTVASNYDVVPTSSRTEGFESGAPGWTMTHVAALSTPTDWAIHASAPLAHTVYVPGSAQPSDVSLTSPAMAVGSGPFTVAFRHRYSFEFDGTSGYDGGVVELTQDGGATWIDIGGSYDGGTIATYSADPNPLAGAPGYVGQSASWPALQTVTLNLGNTYAGKTVQLRFRVGTDSGNGAPAEGWYVDDVTVTGTTDAPFAAIGPSAAACQQPAKKGGGCASGGDAGLAALLGLAGLARLRRRARA